MTIVFPVDKLKLLLHDLELSYGQVDVVSVQQLQASAAACFVTAEECALLTHALGIHSGQQHAELPAVIIVQKLKEFIEKGGLVLGSGMHLKRTESNRLIVERDIYAHGQGSTTSVQFSNGRSISGSKLSNRASEDLLKPHFEKCNSPAAGASQTEIPPIELVDTSFIEITPKGFTGSILDRHMEYSLKDNSQVHPLEVHRRFTDFVDLREFLLAKYPTRTIPRLPAKSIQLFTDNAFIEERVKGLKRFLGVVSKHPAYRQDHAVQAFFSQPSFKVPAVPSRQDALTSQIPTAEVLLHGTSKEEQVLVEKAPADIQKMVSFLNQIKEHLKELIKEKRDECNTLKGIVSTVKESGNLTDCMCRACNDCTEAMQQRQTLSERFSEFIGSAEGITLNELLALEERMSLLLELFGAFHELLNRATGLKYKAYATLDSEIAATEREYEKLRTRPDQESVSQESVDMLRARIDALRADRQQHETGDRFVEYCLWDEVKWMHQHKPALNHLVNQLAHTLSLNAERMKQSLE